MTPFSVLASLIKLRDSALDPGLVELFVEKMAAELEGKTVLLSNGAIGNIKYVDANDIEHPLINVNGETVRNGEAMHCVAMLSA